MNSLLENKKMWYVDGQISTATEWLQQSDEAVTSFLKFSALYSCFNALFWCSSKRAGDRSMLEDFLLRYELKIRSDYEEMAKDILSYTKSNFRNGVRKLHERIEGKEPRQFEFSNGKNMAELEIEELGANRAVRYCIELMYQFRCNLVHGSKDIRYDANKELCSKFCDFMQLFLPAIKGEMHENLMELYRVSREA